MSPTRVRLAAIVLTLAAPTSLRAQAPGKAPAATPPAFTDTVEVIAPTPLPGVGLTLSQVPAPVQTLTSADVDASGALNVADLLNRRLSSIHINDVQGNPFQPDVSYRGYTASPLLGTPQGLSVYMDGVRLNQPFGETVSWDLIPRMAIASGALMAGSNPLFGLNTLGGALSLQTKDGASHRGTSVEARYGSQARRAVQFETGGARSAGLHWYLAGNLFGERGWRDASPSDVRQLFGKLGWRRDSTNTSLTVAHADNSLNGNGLQEQTLLARDYASVYTKPDTTHNRSTLLNLSYRRAVHARLTLSGNAYYRHILTGTLNGDINERALDQALYQPGPAERAALAAAGYTGIPASGLSEVNTPFPFLRCVGNVLLNEHPGEQCNGLINRTHTGQHNAGLSAQATWIRTDGPRTHQVTLGGGFDGSGLAFRQSTELGYLLADRSIEGTGTFADGVNAGTVDGEPLDARVDLQGRLHTSSAFATDTVSLGSAWQLTFSGRFNQTVVHNRDRVTPGPDDRSLTGDHVFRRLNPAAGLTYNPTSALNLYAGYSEGSRAATSIELGCANPDRPCTLPNAMAGDPPLAQVVTRTLESGVRGGASARTSWNAGVFSAENRGDLLFVASSQTGLGYFRNFGRTRRQGFEVGLHSRVGRATLGGGYTWIDATFESAETVNGTGNSSNADAAIGAKGLEGTIDIEPGDRIPFVPRHTLKWFADIQATRRLALDVDLVGVSSTIARGNENNAHSADGIYYLGPGSAPGYAVVNLGGRYDLGGGVQIFAQADNLFDRRYSTAAQLGANGFTPTGEFIARPFPAVNGEFPVQQSTFVAPGAPRAATVGLRVRF